MYGYRSRIGLIVPASNTTCEREIATLCPEGVATYTTRIFFDPSTIHGLLALKKEAGRASRELSCEGICQIIAFCCTSGSMIGGVNYDREITDFIEKESNTLALATATAVMTAFATPEVKNKMIGSLQPESAYEMGLKVNSKENDAIFISCTNFRSIEIIQKLEMETSKPVVTSNQATLWYALRKLGLKDSIKGYGCLMEYY